MSYPLKTLRKTLVGVAGLSASVLAHAGNLGSDLNLTLTPAAGGMGGVG
jgi:hypothetical protein